MMQIMSCSYNPFTAPIQSFTGVEELPSLSNEPDQVLSREEIFPQPNQVPSHNNSSKTEVVKKSRNNTKHRRKRIRRPIPANKEYIPEDQPTEADVISGRGGRSNLHVGNRRYWLEILRQRPAYKACDPCSEEKTAIAKGVCDYVKQNGGRFLQLDEETGRWFVLTERVAIIKVKQAMRDRHVPAWAQKGKKDAARNNQPAATGGMKIKQESPQTVCSAPKEEFNDSNMLDVFATNLDLAFGANTWVGSIGLVDELLNDALLSSVGSSAEETKEELASWECMFSESMPEVNF